METACRVCGGNHKTGACVEKSPGVPGATLKFAKHAEKYLGKEYVESLKVIDEEIAEFDAMVVQGVVSVNELAKYLGEIGFFNHYPQDINDLNEMLDRNEEKIFPSLVRDYGTDGASKKFSKGVAEAAVFRVDLRPILFSVISDIHSVANIRNKLSLQASYKVEPAVKGKVARDPLYIEKSILRETLLSCRNREEQSVACDVDNIMLLARQFEVITNKRQVELNPVEAAEVEEMLDVILQQEVEPGEYFLSAENTFNCASDFFVTIFPEDQRSLMWGAFRLVLRETYVNQSVSLDFDLSIFSKDFCLPEAALAKISQIFDHYGVLKDYFVLRRDFVKAIWNALEIGTIPLKKRPQIIEGESSLGKALEDVLTVEVQNGLVEDNINYRLDDGGQVAEEVKTSILGLENRARKGERVKFSNLSYDRVLRAFQRLGVEVSLGGRHPKLTRFIENTYRSVPFVNKHSKSVDYMARVIKDALKILAIEEEDFVDNLR